MAKALKVAATVVGVVALGVVTAGAGLAVVGAAASLTAGIAAAGAAIGVSLATLSMIGAGLTLGASLLAPKPKAPTASPAAVERLNMSAVLRTPRVIALGSTALATDIRDQEWSSGQDYLHRFVVTASHRIGGYREIWFDDKLAWTSTGGVQGEYAGYLTVTPVTEGSAGNAINIGPRMGSSRRYTGCAYVYFRYKLTGNSKKAESPFASSVPSRVTIIGDAALVYDPRLDSTRGGSGPMRADDQSTWAWAANAGRNPALHLLWYLLGWRINGKLAVGRGLDPARIDFASFIDAANLCDEPVPIPGGGFEARYRSDGLFSEGDDPSLVFDNLKAAMNAVFDDVDGRLRLTVLHNDLAMPAGSFSTHDVIGEFSWSQSPPLSDSINVIRGGYTDPSSASLYQMVDYPEVRIASPDGIDRIQTVDLPLVQSATQARRLVKQRLARAQYGGAYQAVFQATAWKFQKGDVIRFSFFPLGWVDKLFRIADIAVQVDGLVPMMLREEHPDIYAAYTDADATVQGTAPTTYDPSLWPVVQAVAEVEDRIDRVSSDGWLSRGEKQQVIIDRNDIGSAFSALEAKFADLGQPADVQSARDGAASELAQLDAYLGALSPPWNDTASDTPVDPAAYRAAWGEANGAVNVFRAAITGRKGDKGDRGDKGDTGAIGATGANGTTWYTYHAYANSPDGAVDFTTGQAGTRAYQGTGTGTSPTEPDSPFYYSWAEYKGPPFGMATRGTAVVAGDQIIKNGGAEAWDSDAYSTVGYRGGSVASFRPGSGSIFVMVGLNADPNADTDYTGLDHAWHLRPEGGVFIYEDGEQVAAPFVGYDETFVFQVAYDGARVRYLVNGNVYRDIPAPPDHLFYFDSSFAGPGSRITDVGFTPAGARGQDGAPGLDGSDGTPGAPGANGQTSYVHFAFANSADGSVDFTTGDAGGRYYIGTYTDFTAADSGNPAAYTWSRWRGTDGANGIQGPPGANGQATYVHIAYANNADGSIGFSTTDGAGKTYIGTYTDQTLADSGDPAAYTWSLIKGDQGEPGPQGPPGVTAPQPVEIEGTGGDIEALLVNPGQMLAISTEVVVSADQTGSASAQLLVRPKNSGFTVIATGAPVLVGPGSPGKLTAAGTWTNTGTADIFIAIRAVVGGPPGIAAEPGYSNFIRVL